MNTVESNHTESDEDDGHDYGRRNPLEVGVQLRNLLNRGDFLTLHYRNGQLVTRILDVDVRGRTFVFDWGALPEQNRDLLNVEFCQFRASPDGVSVDFRTPAPQQTQFEGRPAFVAPFPEVLFYRQRREYFRVDTPVFEPCMCSGELPHEGGHFDYEVRDLSLGGVGLRTTDERVASLVVGSEIPGATLELRTVGKLSVDLCLVALRVIDQPDGVRRYHLGFRFDSLPGTAENTLQRYITQLEMKRRALART
ncbi:flagellar brake protein [Paraburkholderia caballeronis]|uniref:Flagellar brake protein YcgR n=1 Tax=Paraburkholderia caballeronis TaxID=416943 RepID=A0A1H7SLF1_9BURK|nr:flagellar brake protein [Paraburkholderia caballeronis]PXW22368.1 c-di-GMP-binding flagellar brake protein YcgR [Paraburkholderia caballeronis]PXW96026.1 c-di-GMP-binding flagellar brake protein YcgR [Paraburkholderia caballeronis]RAJ92392.1 c-di-GMP-binding flagellar brake protein YcgR [Paraburkholderia caballeronis]TDV08063.1 c-di-GMP-binding flagellar brake protein YcgR [Paraburkholderia caballeronis]TDV11873.1 c-di-GMP-binding flagellar brake protein YcgR [Paraburkholderia caballeronis]